MWATSEDNIFTRLGHWLWYWRKYIPLAAADEIDIMLKLMPSALELAIKFHETYERLAPEYGYETRKDTRQFDPESANGKLMIAVCEKLLE